MTEQPEPPRPVLMVTTETVPGHSVVRVLGYIHGVAMGSQAQGGTGADQIAIWRMFSEAQRIGANAIVGVRWSEGLLRAWGGGSGSSIHTDVGHRIYGTAVVIEPEAG